MMHSDVKTRLELRTANELRHIGLAKILLRSTRRAWYWGKGDIATLVQ